MLPDHLEEALLRFEAAWKDGPPDPASFRSSAADTRFLLELAHIDIERRVRAGMPVDVSGYMKLFPELAADARHATELAQAECDWRRRAAGSNLTSRLKVETELDLRSLHAKGGLGEVYLADDVQLRRRVAVKVLQDRWASDRRAIRDFQAEADLTSRLDHPGIVSVYGVGTTVDGRPCYAMRFVEGETLDDAIRRSHTLEGRERDSAFRILLTRFVSVCNTIAYAHSRGVVHGDVKPANVLLGQFGETFVLDWGLARATTAEVGVDSLLASTGNHSNYSGAVRGTPAYLSPEQADGRTSDIGPATDVFGLGATLYTILANRAPYSNAASEGFLEKARKGDFVAPHSINRQIPRELDAVCRRAMAVDSRARYASAVELARDVENWLAGEPVSAYSEPWHRQTQRWIARRRTLMSVLIVLALSLPAVTFAATRLVGRAEARAERDRLTAQLKGQAAAEISDYLVQVFQSADPIQLELSAFQTSNDLGNRSTLVRILERGDALAREHLKDQPVVRAGLVLAMGNSYCNLGDYDKAAKLLTESYELRIEHLGVDHPDSIESLMGLAKLQFQRGEYDVAERSLRCVRDWRRREYGANDLRSLRARFYLAFTLLYRPLKIPVNNDHELQEADELLHEVLVGQEQHLPKNHPDIGHTLLLIAGVKSMLPGGNVLAAAYTTRAIAIFANNNNNQTTFGSLTVLYMRAERARNDRHFTDAERLYQEVLSRMRQLLGDRHPIVGMYYGNLAGLYRAMGNLDAAERAARSGLEIIRTTPIRNSPIVVDGIMQYGDGVRVRDRTQAAELYREALRYAREWSHVNQANIKALESRLAEIRDPSSTKAN